MPEVGVISSNSDEIRACLAEENTVFLIFADNTPPWQHPIQSLYDNAIQVARNNSQSLFRVLWIKQPTQLDAELQHKLWNNSAISQAVVLSLGTGLAREIKARYGDGELTGPFDILDAFSQGKPE